MRVTLAPVWREFVLGFLILALANLIVAGFNLLRPYWTRPRATARLFTNLAGSVLFAWMCRASLVANITAPGTMLLTVG